MSPTHQNIDLKATSNKEVTRFLKEQVVSQGICTGCGACVALMGGQMTSTSLGTSPLFSNNTNNNLSKTAYLACPGAGIHYPSLYRSHFGKLPDSWLLGESIRTRIGHAADDKIRMNGASGGVITQTLSYLLEKNYVDVAIVVQQGVSKADSASVIFATSVEEILNSSQSVYTPVSTLDILSKLKPNLRYAITCLPEQSAALRVMQSQGYEPANQIKYVIGPYTGTALEPSAIRCLLRSNKVKDDDEILSLNWRAGAWPGYLEIKTKSGKVIRSKKVYYNFLIPFFVTQTSLQSIDFSNEFSDLSVGDAWSPKYEKLGAGFSVITTRTQKMELIINKMLNEGFIKAEEIDEHKASEMHGHMLDFKKRGGFIRNKWRRYLGINSPDNGIFIEKIAISRYFVEIVISGVFLICRTKISRKILEYIPESIIGPFFNRSRLIWKNLSKPTKRKGLSDLNVSEVDNGRMF